jgi:hypothetical protein
MNEDEAFAASIRPDSVFGALGTSDHFDEEVEEFGEMAEGWDGFEPEEAMDFAESSGASTAQMPEESAAPVKVGGGSASAGFGMLWLVGAGLLGWHFGRAKGAAGGALAAAGARNIYRAQRDMRSAVPEVKASSVRPGLIGLVGLGLGGYLLYEATK